MKFTCYPNPRSEKVKAEFSFDSGQRTKLSLISIKGQLIWEDKSVYSTGEHKEMIDLSKIAKGIYHVNLQTENEVLSVRILKD